MGTYYIDADHGSDAADGLSAANSWLTWGKLVTTSITHGSTVYLRRCDTKYVTTPNDWLNGITGNISTWDTLSIIGDDGSYGLEGDWPVTGDSTTVKLGNSTGGVYAFTFSSFNEYGVLFKNLHFYGGYRFMSFRPGGLIRFENCLFPGSGSTGHADKIASYAIYGIYGNNARVEFRDCTIADFPAGTPFFNVTYGSKEYHFDRCFIYNCGYFATCSYSNDRFYFQDSTIYMTGAMFAFSNSGGIVPENIVFRRCEYSYSSTGLDTELNTGNSQGIFRNSITNPGADGKYYPNLEEVPGAYFEDINGVPGPYARVGSNFVILYDSTSTSQLRSGGGTSFIKYRGYRSGDTATKHNLLEDSTTRLCLSKFNFDLPDADGATQYTAKVYVMADNGWGDDGNLNGKMDSASLYLSVEYLSGADGETLVTRSIADSTEGVEADDTWTELAVGFTPTRGGPAVAKVWLSHWYASDAFCYVDNFLDVT